MPDSADTAEQTKPMNARRAALFPLANLRLSSEVCEGLNGSQRRRLQREVQRTQTALNWMHGEGWRPPALAPSTFGDAEKRHHLQQLSQRRIERCALAYLDSDRAVEPHAALAALMKGRSTYSKSGSASVASYEYGRVSLLKSVEGAPYLRELLPDAVANTLREFVPAQLRTPKEVSLRQ